MSINKPTGIDVHRNKHQMTITWEEGHSSTYTFSLLRYACPCAECRGGHDKMSSDPDPHVYDLPEENSPRTMLRSVDAVGSYAISLNWEDGHHYGIYNWDYLRALCPCPSCRGV